MFDLALVSHLAADQAELVGSMSKDSAVDSIDLELRVRYHECDPMNVVHHGVYSTWLELARTEMLRRRGSAYRDLEARGVIFVVARMNLRFHRPARYDDLLRIHAQAMAPRGIKVDHQYRICRGDELLADGQTTLVCVDRKGRPQRIATGIID